MCKAVGFASNIVIKKKVCRFVCVCVLHSGEKAARKPELAGSQIRPYIVCKFSIDVIKFLRTIYIGNAKKAI